MQLTRNLEFLEFVISRRTIPKVYFYQNESTNVNSYLRINRKLYCCFIETYTNYFSEIVFIYSLSINIYKFRYSGIQNKNMLQKKKSINYSEKL